jgi:hypothetical protein
LLSLVAVHGLDGHAVGTWTHVQTRVFWLKDLLPAALPDVRVMTFGYNANLWNFTGQQTLRSISAKLLSELVDFRRAAEVDDPSEYHKMCID